MPDVIKATTIQVQNIDLVDRHGVNRGTIMGSDQGAGIWLTSPDGTTIAIHAIDGQVGFGLTSKESLDKGKPHNFALSIDKDGKAFLQVVRPGRELAIIPLDDLVK